MVSRDDVRILAPQKEVVMRKFVYYRGGNFDWYWKLVARNGRIVADGAEGYKTKSGVLKAIRRINKLFAAPLPVEEGF